VRDPLVRPYVAGPAVVQALPDKGGWEAVKAAWSRPPASTEQVLHPEKYLAFEAPRLPLAPPLPAGARLLRTGVLGEALIRTFLGEGSEAAAQGWGGDAYKCADLGGRTLLTWRVEWDSAADAREFAAAARRRLGTPAKGSPKDGFDLYTRGEWRFALRERNGGVDLVSADGAAAFDAAILSARRE
jgi:hypothetical protein